MNKEKKNLNKCLCEFLCKKKGLGKYLGVNMKIIESNTFVTLFHRLPSLVPFQCQMADFPEMFWSSVTCPRIQVYGSVKGKELPIL